MEKVKISDIDLDTPIKHKTLPKSYIDRIKAFKKVLSDVDPMSLEKTITNFKKDTHPEREIAIWEKIAETYQIYSQFFTEESKHIVYGAILSASLGDTKEFDKLTKIVKKSIK